MNSQRAKATETAAAKTPPAPSKKRDKAPYAPHIRGASPRCWTTHARTHKDVERENRHEEWLKTLEEVKRKLSA